MKGDDPAEKYLRLIRAYTDGQKSASEFMHEYLDEFKNEGHFESDELFEVLNNLFFACDAYCEDPDLREGYEIGEDQFLKEAAYARRELERLLQERNQTDSAE